MSQSSSDKAGPASGHGRRAGSALLQAGIEPIAPGTYLRKYVLRPRELGAEEAALALGMPLADLEEVLLSKRRIDESMAAKLEGFSQLSRGFWLNMQAAFDLSKQTS